MKSLAVCAAGDMGATASKSERNAPLHGITAARSADSGSDAPAAAGRTVAQQHQQQHQLQNTSQQLQEDESSGSRCPVPEGYRNPAIYNVYGQRINDPSAQPACPSPLAVLGGDMLDPSNNMPLEPNQQPCPGQRKPLSTQRIASTIPKGGTDTTWLYPSPQMFFNGA